MKQIVSTIDSSNVYNMSPKFVMGEMNEMETGMEGDYNDHTFIMNSDNSYSNFNSINTMELSLSDLKSSSNGLRMYWKELLATSVACLAHISMGCALGYTSPALPDLNRSGRRFHLTDAEQSFFSSLLALGAALGGATAGTISDMFGRKNCNILTGVLYTLGWLFIIYTQNYTLLYLGRFITGLSTGLTSLNNSIYVAEIASPAIRGILGSVLYLTANIGLLFVYIMGAYIPWSFLAVAATTFPVMLVVFMCFLPETPMWLAKKRRFDQAEQSLQWLRNRNIVREDMEMLKLEISLTRDKTISISNLTKQTFLKPFTLTFLLMFFQQFSGMIAVIFNAVSIFRSAGTEDPNTAAAILGVINILGAVLAVVFVDKLGRRPLLLISAFLASLSMVGLGSHYYMIKLSIQMDWLPVICLLLFQFAFNFGLGTVPWIIMGEVFPEDSKALATSIITFSCYAMSFVVSQSFLTLESFLQPYGVFWLFASISAIGFIIVYKIVPETKGKSLAEIQKLFAITT